MDFLSQNAFFSNCHIRQDMISSLVAMIRWKQFWFTPKRVAGSHLYLLNNICCNSSSSPPSPYLKMMQCNDNEQNGMLKRVLLMSIYFSLTEKYSSSEYGAKKSRVTSSSVERKSWVLRVDQGTWWSVYFNSAGLDPCCWFCLESYWLASSSYLCTHNTQKQIACCSSLPLIIPHPSINFGPVIVFFPR